MSREKYEKYLNILGLETGVSLKEIKSAYKKMVVKYHPDRQTDPIVKKSANEKLKKINEAREFLLENYKYYGKSFRKERTKRTTSNSNKTASSKNNKDSNTKNEPNLRSEKGIINEAIYRNPNEIEDEAKIFAVVVFILLFFMICCSTDYDNKYSEKELSKNEVTTQTRNQDFSKYVETIDNDDEDEENEDAVIEEDSYSDDVLNDDDSDLISKNIKPPQKTLTQDERNAKFESEMSVAFDKFINNFGKYYNYPQLRDRTFTYNLSCYLNNTMYKSEYISGDFEKEYEGVNLGRDFDSFMMSLPMHFRDDYNTNYEMRYKIQLIHTPKGTTVKLLKVWHYLEGD